MFQCSKNIKMCLVCVFDLKIKSWHLWPKQTFFFFFKCRWDCVGEIEIMALGVDGFGERKRGDNTSFDVWPGGPYNVQDNYTIATEH